MTVTKLVVKEFMIGESVEQAPVGYKYSYFFDPQTGKWYRPKQSFVVEGDNLEELFEEIPTELEKSDAS